MLPVAAYINHTINFAAVASCLWQRHACIQDERLSLDRAELISRNVLKASSRLILERRAADINIIIDNIFF